MRDDFAQPIKNTLAARTGYKCSNPNCRATTSGPQADAQKAANLGVAAHITGAAPGGERYDPVLTSAQRSSMINGVWLCQNCAHLIDADVSRYSVALLYHWKIEAEIAAHQDIGKPQAATPPAPRNQVPHETIRVVQQKKESRWSNGSSGETPIMFLHFVGSITEISGKEVRVVVAEIPSPARQAEMVLICNDHDCRRPQFLRPHETADLSLTFIIPPVSNLETDGSWRSPITLVDQFGNHHELPDCVFQCDPMSKP
jgi:hypothetical protein